MRNIDFIYMINLDHRPEKLKMSLDQMAPYGIFPYRFSAVNGWELSLETLNAVGLQLTPQMDKGLIAMRLTQGSDFTEKSEGMNGFGLTYFAHNLTRGAIGCSLSHISILQDAFDAGYETIWVMEDDIAVVRDPRIISDLIERLDQLVGHENWDVLFTDKEAIDTNAEPSITDRSAYRPDSFFYSDDNDYALNIQISPDFRKIGARFGSYSMILRRSGFKKLLGFFHSRKIFLPYDAEYIFPAGINLYTVLQDVVSTIPTAITDIQL